MLNMRLVRDTDIATRVLRASPDDVGCGFGHYVVGAGWLELHSV
jgi:hypothetical protein